MAIGAALFAGCSPVLDWREVRPPGTAIALTFPCKPTSHVRKLTLAGTPVDVAMHVCDAGGLTWALTVAEVDDPRRVTVALRELRAAAQANLRVAPAPLLAVHVAGATPNEQAGQAQLNGVRADGQPVQEVVMFFARATQVYQATVLGQQVSPDLVQTFLSSIRSAP